MSGKFSSTSAAFATMPGGAAALRHIQALDSAWAAISRGERGPAVLHQVPASALPDATDGTWDLVYAGGGLGLLHALAMAQTHGRRVLVFDAGAIGQTHREWNSSQDELQRLVDAGLFGWDELEGVIGARYRRGFIRFFQPEGPVAMDLPGVLDVAIDASALLRLARHKFEAAGGTVREGRRLRTVWLATDGPPHAVVEVDGPGGIERYGARVLVNALGATSPLSLALAGAEAPFEGVCPTVGTVVTGCAPGEVDPTVGEILVTTSDADSEGRQLIWEGFPGGDGFTIYLFFYDLIRPQRPQSLMALFESYFQRLGEYKRPGPDFRHLRPVYGFIPARHHLDAATPASVRAGRGLLSLGDAAARQSPLTFTGFGSHTRHLARTAALLDYALTHNLLEADELAHISAGQTNLRAMWVLARFLQPWGGTRDVNALLGDFTQALHEIGPERARHFFRDQGTWHDYVEIMTRTARHHPAVFRDALQVLRPAGIAQWLHDLATWGWAEATPPPPPAGADAATRLAQWAALTARQLSQPS